MEKSAEMKFLKKIDRLVTMTNGHIRAFFIDGSELVVMNSKRGLVLPRRKRTEARALGLIR